MIIRLSAKLATKLHERPKNVLAQHENPFADWSAHLFISDRSQYILVTHTITLYSFVMFGRGIADSHRFLVKMASHLSDQLEDDGFKNVYTELIAPTMNTTHFSKALNRSVTGSMNDLVYMAKNMLEDEDRSNPEISSRLNDIPMSAIDYLPPRKAFQALVT